MSDTSPTAAPRPAGSVGLYLAVATVIVAAAALFAGTRAKPPVIYAAGFGLVLGLVLRFVADSLNVPRRWPMAVAASLIVGIGFVISFLPAYRARTAEWESRRTEQPTDPIAIALLRQASDDGNVPETPPYSVDEFLSRRLPGWPEPWPRVVFGGELIMSMLLAALAMGVCSRKSAGSKDGDANAQDVPVPELR